LVLELLLEWSLAKFEAMLKSGEDAQEGFAESFQSCKVNSFSETIVPETNLECGAYLPDCFKFVSVLLRLW
jgi:hypothetical protein